MELSSLSIVHVCVQLLKSIDVVLFNFDWLSKSFVQYEKIWMALAISVYYCPCIEHFHFLVHVTWFTRGAHTNGLVS